MIITLFAFYNYYNQYKVMKHLDEQVETLNGEIHSEKEKQVELKTKQDYYNSDDYIEDQAREKFGLVGEDETIFIIEE